MAIVPPNAIWTPSTTDKLGVILILIRSAGAAAVRAFQFPFLSHTRKTANFYTDVAFTFLRTMLSSFSLAQDLLLQQSTEANYMEYVQSAGLEPASVTLPDGCSAHWIGSKTAESLILWFPGGGYMMAPAYAHFLYVHNLVKACEAKGKSMSALLLGYKRSFEAPYPTQLCEAVALLKYIIEDLKLQPSQIIIGGDSAGGHLAISLLSHLMHKHPAIDALTIPSPIRAFLLLSPSVSTETEKPSWYTNAEKDILTVDSKTRWGKAFAGNAPLDPYLDPLGVERAWWDGLGNYASNILIWAGEDEVMRDGIIAWGEIMKGVDEAERKKGRRAEVTTIVTPREAHAHMIMEKVLGYKEPGRGARTVEEWLLEHV